MTADGNIVFEDVGQIKLATHYDRQNVRFNDVNGKLISIISQQLVKYPDSWIGDGKADLLWINKYTGDTTVWYNAGEIPTSGSHFKWENQGALYKAWDRGSNMAFGALGGQHRADIIQVIPRTNIAYISYNRCPGGTGSGGDDPDMSDPDLPAYSPNGCPSGVCPLAAITFPDNSCDGDKQTAISREFQYTAEMALETHNNLQRGEYYTRFFAASIRDDDFALNSAQYYQNIATMLSGSPAYTVRATCDGKSKACRENDWYAHMYVDCFLIFLYNSVSGSSLNNFSGYPSQVIISEGPWFLQERFIKSLIKLHANFLLGMMMPMAKLELSTSAIASGQHLRFSLLMTY